MNTSSSFTITTTNKLNNEFTTEYDGDEAYAISIIDTFKETYLTSIREPYLAYIRGYFQDIIDKDKKRYTRYELETFSIQQTEWIKWNADNTVVTPFCDALAAGRGVDRLVLLNKVGTKILEISSFLGKQHMFEDLLNGATSEEEIKAIRLPFSQKFRELGA